jgi:hypothetical protein
MLLDLDQVVLIFYEEVDAVGFVLANPLLLRNEVLANLPIRRVADELGEVPAGGVVGDGHTKCVGDVLFDIGNRAGHLVRVVVF